MKMRLLVQEFEVKLLLFSLEASTTGIDFFSHEVASIPHVLGELSTEIWPHWGSLVINKTSKTQVGANLDKYIHLLCEFVYVPICSQAAWLLGLLMSTALIKWKLLVIFIWFGLHQVGFAQSSPLSPLWVAWHWVVMHAKFERACNPHLSQMDA